MTYERLSAQDASFLHVEGPTAPMHVGGLSLFEGPPFFDADGRFRLDEARDIIGGRLHKVPKFRKKLMWVPLAQGRPVWVDDADFDLAFHVRLTALPRPGDEEQLKTLMARLQATPLDRSRPLWELWFVEGVSENRVAIIQKTHHALVDGVSGVDVATVILDLELNPPPAEAPAWHPEPAPSSVALLTGSVVERTTQPAEIVRSLRAAVRGPRRAAGRALTIGRAVRSMAETVPTTSLSVPVGPHRRFEMVRTRLDTVKTIKAKLGGTVNDVVLAAVAGALRRFLEHRGEDVAGLTLKAMVPVSVRDESERMLLGNRVAAMMAALPVGLSDPVARLDFVREQMQGLKESEQAVGAETLMALAEYAPPTLLSLAGRLLPRQRQLNLVITNVPGPQFPLYCMGARMLEAFPYVPVFDSVPLVVAVLSYDGKLCFGLSADRDAVSDLPVFGQALTTSIQELENAVT